MELALIIVEIVHRMGLLTNRPNLLGSAMQPNSLRSRDDTRADNRD